KRAIRFRCTGSENLPHKMGHSISFLAKDRIEVITQLLCSHYDLIFERKDTRIEIAAVFKNDREAAPLICAACLPAVGLGHLDGGLGDYFAVAPERPAIDVLTVESHDFVEVIDFAVATQLPWAGYARLHTQAPRLMSTVLADLGHRARTGADQAHVAHE